MHISLHPRFLHGEFFHTCSQFSNLIQYTPPFFHKRVMNFFRAISCTSCYFLKQDMKIYLTMIKSWIAHNYRVALPPSPVCLPSSFICCSPPSLHAPSIVFMHSIPSLHRLNLSPQRSSIALSFSIPCAHFHLDRGHCPSPPSIALALLWVAVSLHIWSTMPCVVDVIEGTANQDLF